MCTSPHLGVRFKKRGFDRYDVQIVPDTFQDELTARRLTEYNRFRLFECEDFYFLKIPCGQCFQCRMAYARTWANRAVMEAAMYPCDMNWFVTLTYDDEHLEPLVVPGLVYKTVDGDFPVTDLDVDIVQRFLKRLRRRWQYQHNFVGIRFFQASEYGDLHGRSHHHFLLFNCPIFDLHSLGCNKYGDQLYYSEELSEVWENGIVCIGKLNWSTAAYTARYMVKKQKGNNTVYSELGIRPPFTTVSRNPGLAYDWYLLYNQGIYRQVDLDQDNNPIFYDSIVLPSNGDSANVVKPPRFFDEHLKQQDPERYEMIKEYRRRVGELADAERRKRVEYDERTYFEIQDRKQSDLQKGFLRNLDGWS